MKNTPTQKHTAEYHAAMAVCTCHCTCDVNCARFKRVRKLSNESKSSWCAQRRNHGQKRMFMNISLHHSLSNRSQTSTQGVGVEGTGTGTCDQLGGTMRMFERRRRDLDIKATPSASNDLSVEIDGDVWQFNRAVGCVSPNSRRNGLRGDESSFLRLQKGGSTDVLHIE
jgi:hypothetical protein